MSGFPAENLAFARGHSGEAAPAGAQLEARAGHIWHFDALQGFFPCLELPRSDPIEPCTCASNVGRVYL